MPVDTRSVTIFKNSAALGTMSSAFDLPSDDILRINLKTIAEKRGEPRLAERPILVLPVGRYFVAVYKICQAFVEASPKAGDAADVESRIRSR